MGTSSTVAGFLTSFMDSGLFADAPRGSLLRKTLRGGAAEGSEASASESGLVWMIWTVLFEGGGVMVATDGGAWISGRLTTGMVFRREDR